MKIHALALVFEVQFTSVMRGPHIYKSVWTPTLGGKLNWKPNNMMNMQFGCIWELIPAASL